MALGVNPGNTSNLNPPYASTPPTFWLQHSESKIMIGCCVQIMLGYSANILNPLLECTLLNQDLNSVNETLDPFRRLHPHYHLEYLDMPCGCILWLAIWNPDFTRSCMLHARCSASRSGHRKLEFLCQDDPRTIQARITSCPQLLLCYRRFQKT